MCQASSPWGCTCQIAQWGSVSILHAAQTVRLRAQRRVWQYMQTVVVATSEVIMLVGDASMGDCSVRRSSPADALRLAAGVCAAGGIAGRAERQAEAAHGTVALAALAVASPGAAPGAPAIGDTARAASGAGAQASRSGGGTSAAVVGGIRVAATGTHNGAVRGGFLRQSDYPCVPSNNRHDFFRQGYNFE